MTEWTEELGEKAKSQGWSLFDVSEIARTFGGGGTSMPQDSARNYQQRITFNQSKKGV